MEPLLAVPGHVLDHEQRAVDEEDVVEHTVRDDGFVGALDDAREDGEAAGFGGVGAVDEDVDVAAFDPFCGGGVDGLLDVRAAEVDGCAGGEVVLRAGEAENVPELGTGCRYLVVVEAGVDLERCAGDLAPQVAAFGAWGRG